MATGQTKMKRIDRLILGEVFGPWAFGVAIFTVLIMAGTFLYTFTRMLSEGVPPILVIRLAALYLPGILAKTFSMAMLLGTLLAFGRLSGDSEIVALRASGVSVMRMMVPIAAFGLAVSLATYLATDYVVPAASYQATSLQAEIVKSADSSRARPTSQPIYEKGQLRGQLNARDFNLIDQTLSDVTIVTFNKSGKAETLFVAPKLVFNGLDSWEARGKCTLYILSSKMELTMEDAWPADAVRPTATPRDLVARSLTDLDSFSSWELAEQIEKLRQDPNAPKDQIVNLEFGYWNKFAVPLAALVFGLVGAPLGIRNHRAGTATGFWLSVIIIFGYMLVTNAMSIMAQGGAIPAWVASFGPILGGTIVAVQLIRTKNGQ